MEKLYYIEALLTLKGIEVSSYVVLEENRNDVYASYFLYNGKTHKHYKTEDIGKVSLALKSTQVKAAIYAWESEVEGAKVEIVNRLSQHVEKKIKDMQKMLELVKVENITIS